MSEIEHEFTDEIVCPYCGYEYSECYEFTEDDDSTECPKCEKFFSYSRHTQITYTTTKLCKENKEEHKYKPPSVPHMHRGKWISGKHCEVCNHCELVEVNQETGEIIT